jgi:S1-C subfamily serine protease
VSVPPPPAATGGGKGKGLIVGAIAAVVVLVAVVGFVVLRGGGEATDQELFEEAKRSTVLIGASVNGRSTGSGTGWVLDAEQGLIVTNQHVVNSGTAWSVGLGTDKQPAVLIGSAPCEDLAVLRVSDRRNLRTLPIGKQTDFKQGDRVIALGYPGTASASPTLVFTAGNISAVNTTWDAQSLDVPSYPNVVLHTAQINPGNSGGPLINSSGELVGVNSAGLTQRGGRPIQGQNYAVGADRVKEIVGRLRTGKSIFYTGMSFDYPTTERDFDDFDLPVVDGGIIVPFATPESPAANAGFGTEPVVLVAVDGKELNGTLQSYCQAVRGVRDGDQVPFTIVLSSGRQGDIRVRVPV